MTLYFNSIVFWLEREKDVKQEQQEQGRTALENVHKKKEKPIWVKKSDISKIGTNFNLRLNSWN